MIKYVPTRDFLERDHFLSRSATCLTLVNFFAETYRVPLAFFDDEGNQVAPLSGTQEFCTNFASLSDQDKIPKQCLRFHKELFSSARDKEKIRIAKCPAGLYYFAIPLLIEGHLIGILSGGGMISEAREDICSKCENQEMGKEKLLSLYKELPSMSRKDMEQLICRFAASVRVCIEESYEKHHSNRQLRKLIFASKINEMVNTKMKLEDLLERTTREIADAVEVDICLILLWDKARKDYSLFAVSTKLSDNHARMKFRMGEGITGVVASTGKSIIIKDALQDPRIIMKSLAIKSLMAVPLKVGGDTIGVLHAGSIKKKRDFTQRELGFVEALSSEVALAVNNTMLYEESLKKTDELQRSKMELQSYFSQIGTALSSALNLHQLLRMIVELSIKMVGSDAGSLYLIEDRKLTSQVTAGLEKEHAQRTQFRLQGSLIGWEKEGSFLSGIPPQEPSQILYRQAAPHDTITSYLGIPLSIKDEIIGLLNIYSRGGKEFATEKIELLTAFANQSAMAIDNALNFEKEQKRAKEATLLYEAAREIGQSFDMEEILNISVENLTKITQVDRCLIFLFDDKKREFYMASHTGLSPEQREFFSYYRIQGSEVSQDIWDDLTRGKPRIFTTIPPDCPALEKLFQLFPTNSCLLIPLIAREKLLGLTYIDDSKMAHFFSDSQIRLVMTLSIQMATALQRARLITKQEENTNQLKALLQVSSVLPSSLSLPKVFNLVVEKAAQLVSKPSVALLIMDDDMEKDFVLQASRGLEEPLKDSSLQKQIAESAIDKKRYTTIYYNEETDDETGKSLWKCGIGGALSIPLIAKRRLVGVLNCFCELEYQFTFDEIRLLRSFANHAAIAVENARLHGVVRNKVRELATLFEVGKAITSTLQFDRVLEEITKNVKRAMNADACSIMLIDEDRKELAFKTAIGLSRSQFGQRIKLGEGVAGIAAKTARPMILLDLQIKKSPYVFPRSIREEGLKTILSVPLETKGRIIGIINIYLKEIYYYKPLEINLLVALANQAAIAIENARLYEAQAKVAKILQSIVMPQKDFAFPGIELGYYYISSLELSGDYFDLIPLGATKFSLVIADVSGKGPPAAIYTARAKYILKSYAIAGYQPREILGMVNYMIVPETGDEKFISLFYMEIDMKKKLIRFSSAGHEPPIYACQKTKELKLLEAEGLLIGVSYDAKFRQEEISFESGDVLILYTDGITEARGNKGEMFGLERLMEIVKKNMALDPQSLANRIYTAVQKYTRRKLNDDFSLLVVRL